MSEIDELRGELAACREALAAATDIFVDPYKGAYCTFGCDGEEGPLVNGLVTYTHAPDCPRQSALNGPRGAQLAAVLAAAGVIVKWLDKHGGAFAKVEHLNKLREEWHAAYPAEGE